LHSSSSVSANFERSSKRISKTCPHVIKLYRQLVANYERSRQYELAGDFHYGAMELRRKQLSLSVQEKLKGFRA